jgi:signal transduction histidine kinase
MLAELDGLTKNVEHIKQIVAMQQSYSKLGGVRETLSLAEVVDDALQLNDAALGRHGVKVAREYEPLPPLALDRHKVLQILINLIRNAKYALDDANPPVKQLTIRLGRNGCNTVQVAVSDNGVGIAPENLTRIFQHGFTTRKDGHGFGLHNAALAAQEMGGTLRVHSDGTGRGATFTLELPLPSTTEETCDHP